MLYVFYPKLKIVSFSILIQYGEVVSKHRRSEGKTTIQKKCLQKVHAGGPSEKY